MPYPPHRTKSRSQEWAAAVSLLLLFTGAVGLLGDSLRVTTWDFSAAGASPKTPSQLSRAASGLKALSPDVVLLRGVRNWPECEDLVRALGTNEYVVVLCSSLEGNSATGNLRQLAMVAKRKAYFSWSDGWGGSGGLIFAAIQTGRQRIGFWVVQADAGLSEAKMLEKWQTSVGSFQRWGNNRLDSMVVALSVQDAAGRGQQARELSAQQRLAGLEAAIRAPFSQNLAVHTGPGSLVSARLTANPETTPAIIASQWPATLDLSIEPSHTTSLVSVDGNSSPQTAGGDYSFDPFASSRTRVSSAYSWADPYVAGALKLVTHTEAQPVATAVATFLALLITAATYRGIRRRKLDRRRRLTPMPGRHFLAGARAAGQLDSGLPPAQGLLNAPVDGSSEAVTLLGVDGNVEEWRGRALAAEAKAERAAELVRAGAGMSVGELLKTALVQKLVTDRSTLMENQEAVALRAKLVDERLARIETQVREQSQAYEQRIAELTRDLAAAKEENRTLIQSKIFQVKAEMATVRAKILEDAERLRSEDPVRSWT